MPFISDLIQEQRDAGLSFRDLARKSGDRLDHQTFDRLHKQATTQFPRDAEAFEGLALALDTTVEQVVLSMAAQLGIPVRRPSLSPPIPGAERLRTDQLAALRALVRSIVPSEMRRIGAPPEEGLGQSAAYSGNGEHEDPRQS